MGDCLCNFRQHMVGDGCHICNPELAKELEAMTDEEYCRETAQVCGLDLSDARWCLCNDAGWHLEWPLDYFMWHPHTNVVQALEWLSHIGATVHIDRSRVLVKTKRGHERVYLKDCPTTEAAVCAAIRGCWEAGRE